VGFTKYTGKYPRASAAFATDRKPHVPFGEDRTKPLRGSSPRQSRGFEPGIPVDRTTDRFPSFTVPRPGSRPLRWPGNSVPVSPHEAFRGPAGDAAQRRYGRRRAGGVTSGV